MDGGAQFSVLCSSSGVPFHRHQLLLGFLIDLMIRNISSEPASNIAYSVFILWIGQIARENSQYEYTEHNK